MFAQLQDGLFKVRIKPDDLPDVHRSPWTRGRISSSDRGIDFCQTLHVILVGAFAYVYLWKRQKIWTGGANEGHELVFMISLVISMA